MSWGKTCISGKTLKAYLRNLILGHRVLIVSPHFPPINAPDHQRVRMSLPYFQEFGWEPHVLSVHPNHVQAVQDSLLEQTIPKGLSLTQTKALPVKLTKQIGLSDLGWRSLPYFVQVGNQLLRRGQFDLVYFSTTVFLIMGLAAYWHKQFGIPYVLDMQDPWKSDYHHNKDTKSPPGGRLKYGFAQLMASKLEPQAMHSVSHIISVSSEYPKTLQQRYSWLRPDQFTVLPFGAAETDFKLLPSLNIQQTIFDPNDGKRHWVYVGRGGSDMALALRSLFLAIQKDRQQNPAFWQSTKLHFVGTSYASGDRANKTIEPIAQELDILDLVEEYPHRIPYFEALQTLVDSDAILLIGSDDPGYTASKLYPCILARKPIFAIFHQQSSVVDILRGCQAGHAVTFQSGDRSEQLLSPIIAQLQWLQSRPKDYQPNTNWSAFQPYTAREMTRRQCAIFDQVLTATNKGA